MEDYYNIDHYIQKLKLAAIDAYMQSEVDSLFASCKRRENYYLVTTPGFLALSESIKITRPNSRGEGGGESDSSNASGYVEEFNEIRDRIDSIIRPWKDLPNPEAIRGQIEEWRGVVSRLAANASTRNNISVGGGTIDDKIASVKMRLGQMSGQTIIRFESGCVDNVKNVTEGLHAVSLILGGSLGAELGIFEGAREAVMNIIRSATDLFASIANDGKGNLRSVLNISKKVIKGLEIFVPGAAGKGVSALSFLIDFVKISDDEDIVIKDADSFEKAMNYFKSALERVNSSIKECENAIKKNINDNITAIHAHKENFDIKIDAINSSEISAKEIRIEDDYINDIVHSLMPSISTELDDTAKMIGNVSMSNCINRDKKIGIGISGPSKDFDSLKWLFYRLITDLSWDVRNSATNFKHAIEYIHNEDINTKTKLDNFATSIEKGNQSDPWIS